MGRFLFEATIEASRDDVYDFLTDPERMPQWLPITEAIEAASGRLNEPGATFVQRGAPGIRRPGRVVATDPPASLHLELKGGGERVDVVYDLEERGDETHVRLDVTVVNAPPILGPMLDRVGAARLDRRMWRPALEGLKRAIERANVTAHAGEVYALRGGGRIRIGRVIEVDDRWVHLELLPGSWKEVPATAADLEVGASAPKDAFAVRPLERTFRDVVALTRHGSDALLADGGFGIPHLPLTLAAFRAAEPRRVAFDVPGAVDGAHVEAWRRRGGVAFGDLLEPGVGAYYSVVAQAMGVEAIGFGIVKLLKTQFRGVHVRVFSNLFLERPTSVDESALEMATTDVAALVASLVEASLAETEMQAVDPTLLPPPPTRPVAMEHLPLSHRTFGSWQPEFIRMALVEPEEMRGYEMWKREKGGFF